MPIGRESGMPEVAYWETFFDPDCMLRCLGVGQETKSIAEFGCGYGTFTIPAARRISGLVSTFDIDQEMVDFTTHRAKELSVQNVVATKRDFMKDGTGLPDESVDFVMLQSSPYRKSATTSRRVKTHSQNGWKCWRHSLAVRHYYPTRTVTIDSPND
jgi:SAM-dependent methyltransferase